MSAAAAFFANKKSKKKAFKFNANLVDADSVTQTVHVDAPALSTDQEASQQPSYQLEGLDGNENKSDWDDEALAVAYTSGVSISTTGMTTTAELGTLHGTSAAAFANDDIAEKLRLEDTKAQLAAARLGMERQAALREEEKKAKAAGATAAAAASPSLGTSKWLPPHQRAGGSMGSMGLRGRMPTSYAAKIDVADTESFPDLHQAEKILEAQKPKKSNLATVKKPGTGMLGGATWATKKAPVIPASVSESAEPVIEEKSSKSSAPVELQSAETSRAEDIVVCETPSEAPTIPEPAVTVDVPSPMKKVPTKKKKKDLSTFKATA